MMKKKSRVVFLCEVRLSFSNENVYNDFTPKQSLSTKCPSLRNQIKSVSIISS